MYKELWFEDGYYAFGQFTRTRVYDMMNIHGLIIREKVYQTRF